MDLNLAKRYGWSIINGNAEVHFEDISYYWENDVFYVDIGLGKQIAYDGKDEKTIISLLDVGLPYVEKFDIDIEIELED